MHIVALCEASLFSILLIVALDESSPCRQKQFILKKNNVCKPISFLTYKKNVSRTNFCRIKLQSNSLKYSIAYISDNSTLLTRFSKKSSRAFFISLAAVAGGVSSISKSSGRIGPPPKWRAALTLVCSHDVRRLFKCSTADPTHDSVQEYLVRSDPWPPKRF